MGALSGMSAATVMELAARKISVPPPTTPMISMIFRPISEFSDDRTINTYGFALIELTSVRTLTGM